MQYKYIYHWIFRDKNITHKVCMSGIYGEAKDDLLNVGFYFGVIKDKNVDQSYVVKSPPVAP